MLRGVLYARITAALMVISSWWIVALYASGGRRLVQLPGPLQVGLATGFPGARGDLHLPLRLGEAGAVVEGRGPKTAMGGVLPPAKGGRDDHHSTQCGARSRR